MIDSENIPPVADDEEVARFVLSSSEYRSDGTVHHKLFLPYKRVELSVNRLRNSTETETWQVGRGVAFERDKSLLGRSDISVMSCAIETLRVEADPILPANPNHANIVGYPANKEDQMSLAQELASRASRIKLAPV